jgi:phage tail-like protein
MYSLLPAVYRRFDAEREVLRCFLELPGSQLDQLYSWATSVLSVRDLGRVDGRLLPLIAQWIGWRTDHGATVRAQRNEVAYAPAVYRSIGALPAAVATVNRVTGRSARIKEYVHNVARTNQPERLNLWGIVRDRQGTWGIPALVSTNAAHEGRATHVRDTDGSDLVVFHTARRRGWNIWAKRRVGTHWEPSGPLVDRPGVDLHPSAAMQVHRMWVFWEAPDPIDPADDSAAVRDRRWRLWFRARTDGTWSDPAVLGGAAAPSRRSPAAVADDAGGLWLFWREWTDAGWRIRYDRHDGSQWQRGDIPAEMPAEAHGVPVSVEDDLVALFRPGAAAGRLWLFWSRRVPDADGQRRWEIALRVKQSLDPAAADWSDVRVVPKDAPADQDREPAPLLTTDGNLELFWASTRSGGWAVVRAELDLATTAWGPAQRIGAGTFTNRAPLALPGPDGETLLIYRSSESLAHDPKQRILDARYVGSHTVRVGDVATQGQRGRYEDVQTYTYQAAPAGDVVPISRDTIGVFPEGAPEPAEVTRLRGVLPEFLPASVRAVVQGP